MQAVSQDATMVFITTLSELAFDPGYFPCKACIQITFRPCLKPVVLCIQVIDVPNYVVSNMPSSIIFSKDFQLKPLFDYYFGRMLGE